MCFNIHPYCKEAKVATEDIKCWKIFNACIFPGLTSPYMRYTYFTNEVYKTRFVFSYNGRDISEGFHSFKNRAEAKGYKKRNFYKKIKSIRLCIIPAGAEYYYNPYDQQYVSNKIIIPSRLKVLFRKSINQL